jgi:hypothetical protein
MEGAKTLIPKLLCLIHNIMYLTKYKQQDKQGWVTFKESMPSHDPATPGRSPAGHETKKNKSK